MPFDRDVQSRVFLGHGGLTAFEQPGLVAHDTAKILFGAKAVVCGTISTFFHGKDLTC